MRAGVADPLGSPYLASTAHMTIPPTMSAIAITCKLSKFLPISLVSKNEGTAVHTKATAVNVRGWFQTARRPSRPVGKVERKVFSRERKYKGKQRMAPSWMTMEYIFQ